MLILVLHHLSELTNVQSGVLKDFELSVELATSLLSPTLDPMPTDAATQEYLWQLCDYGWLTNSARRSSVPTETPRFDTFTSPLAFSSEATMGATAYSPDFETLLEGALSFDFGMLSQVNAHTNSMGAYNE